MASAVKNTIESTYYHLRMEVNQAVLANQLRNRDEAAFEQVFRQHYRELHAYALSMLRDEEAAEEMVQSVFFKLWERAAGLNITGSVAAYLYRAVHNESLNHLKHIKVKNKHQLYVSYSMKDEAQRPSVHLKELESKLRNALNELPEQCRTIFQLSRFEELRYREIADRLELSVKTVENQMGKALKLLRIKLVDFLPFIIILFNS